MGYTVEHITHIGERKLKKPQMVFRFGITVGNISTVKRIMSEMNLAHNTHYRIHPATLPYDSAVRVIWVSDEAYIQAKMVFL